jgi:hypothetical protein
MLVAKGLTEGEGGFRRDLKKGIEKITINMLKDHEVLNKIISQICWLASRSSGKP